MGFNSTFEKTKPNFMKPLLLLLIPFTLFSCQEEIKTYTDVSVVVNHESNSAANVAISLDGQSKLNKIVEKPGVKFVFTERIEEDQKISVTASLLDTVDNQINIQVLSENSILSNSLSTTDYILSNPDTIYDGSEYEVIYKDTVFESNCSLNYTF